MLLRNEGKDGERERERELNVLRTSLEVLSGLNAGQLQGLHVHLVSLQNVVQLSLVVGHLTLAELSLLWEWVRHSVTLCLTLIRTPVGQKKASLF